MSAPEELRGPNVIGGAQIPWEQVHELFLRVQEFTPYATVEGGCVVHPGDQSGVFLPYALAHVEARELPGGGAILPVLHKVDFTHAWLIFRERGVAATEEVLVAHSPPRQTLVQRLTNQWLPHLHWQVWPKGALEELHDWLDGKTRGGPRVQPIGTWEFEPRF